MLKNLEEKIKANARWLAGAGFLVFVILNSYLVHIAPVADLGGALVWSYARIGELAVTLISGVISVGIAGYLILNLIRGLAGASLAFLPIVFFPISLLYWFFSGENPFKQGFEASQKIMPDHGHLNEFVYIGGAIISSIFGFLAWQLALDFLKIFH